MEKKVINFNDGQVKVELNSEVRYSIDFERKQTLLIINELPTQTKKAVTAERLPKSLQTHTRV